VETNAEDLTQPDSAGICPPLRRQVETQTARYQTHFPAFYTKYVVDELLYKFPEAAAVERRGRKLSLDSGGQLGKTMVSGGIKSLYDAHRSLWTRFKSRNTSLSSVSLNVDFEDAELGIYAGSTVVVVTVSQGRKVMDGIIQAEQHDTIMLVQQADVDISEVITSMWAHEEDAGVQMLGCVVPTVVGDTENRDGVLRISLSAVAAVVNAMKAHPNEVVVQEKACHALQLMASSDGKREVSFVASGAVAAIVGPCRRM
jgi:hypothetical protein